MTRLAGRSAIVTGASQGLGRAFAAALVREGAHVALCDVQPSVAEVADALAGPGKALGIVADVARESDVVRLVESALASADRLDLLVNNAARWRQTPVTAPLDAALADWDHVMGTNLRGVLLLSRACVPHLVAAGGGDIVQIGADDVLPARRADANPPDADLYTASKWALNGFTQAWARALASKRVRVNALCVGPTDTPGWRAQQAGDAGTRLAPDEVAALFVELLLEGPSGRTGENVGVWPGEPLTLGPRKPPHRTITG
jgi:2-hydroxycyclohexanecarboxyl-CoA dehydrogenase